MHGNNFFKSMTSISFIELKGDKMLTFQTSLTASIKSPPELRDRRRHLPHPRRPLLPIVLVLLRAVVVAQPSTDATRVHAAHARLQDPDRFGRRRRPPPRPACRGPARTLLAPT